MLPSRLLARFPFLLIISSQSALNVLAYNELVLPNGQSSFNISAGTLQTVNWTNPSNDTVLIQIMGFYLNGTGANTHITLTSGVPAVAESASFVIEPWQVSADLEYEFCIFDDAGIPGASSCAYVPFYINGASGPMPTTYLASSSSTATNIAFPSDIVTSSMSSAQSSSVVAISATSTSSTPVPSAHTTGTSKGLSPGAKAGISIGAVLGAGIFVLIAYCFGLQRSKKKSGNHKPGIVQTPEMEATKSSNITNSTRFELDGEMAGVELPTSTSSQCSAHPSYGRRMAELEAIGIQRSELDARAVRTGEEARGKDLTSVQ